MKTYDKVYDENGENPIISSCEFYRAVLLLAGWTYTSEHELVNGYTRGRTLNPQYSQPWLMVITAWGPIQIGWRKRVLNIEWGSSKYPNLQILEDEQVTNWAGGIHAYGYEKAIVYLRELKLQFERMDYINGLEEPKRSEEYDRLYVKDKANKKKWEAGHALKNAVSLVKDHLGGVDPLKELDRIQSIKDRLVTLSSEKAVETRLMVIDALVRELIHGAEPVEKAEV